jgi:hypothetical protein
MLLFAFFLFELFMFKREKKKIESTKEIIELHVRLAENAVLVEQLEACKANKLSKYPFIHKYLSQNTMLIDHYFSLDNVKFCKSQKNIDNWNFDAFLKEFIICSDKKIQEALKNTIEIIDSLYRHKHPVLYRLQSFKKNVLAHFLSLVLRIHIKVKVNKSIRGIPVRNNKDLQSSIRESVGCRMSMTSSSSETVMA